MRVCLFDPGLENNSGSLSANLGDLIIQEAVVRELSELFPDCEIVQIATHCFPSSGHLLDALKCQLIFVGGTNLLGSSMDKYKQWKVSLTQKIILRKAILFGVGWERYQVRPNFYTRLSLNAALSNKLIHSVRDNYTKQKIHSAGINNVVNTGCPTMWPLVNIKPEEITTKKAANALVMLTDYAKDPELDGKLLELITAKYEKVFIWPQGRGDQEYITELTSSLQVSAIILEHSLDAFKDLLNSSISLDYIGTRLHGGIKCLLAKRRSLIIAIDSRAKEIARDTNLPTVEREDFQSIIQWIEGSQQVDIKIDLDAIHLWKSQFRRFSLERS